MSFNKFSNRFDDAFSKAGGYTADLNVVDYKVLGSTKAKLLFTYSDTPNRENVINYIASNFDKNLIPDIASLKLYTAIKAMSIEVDQAIPVKELNVAGLKKVTANAYLGSDNTIWNITEKDGQKMLQKTVAEDVLSILKARQDLFNKESILTFSRLTAEVAGTSVIEEGDEISWLDNKKTVTGSIIKICTDKYIATTASGDTWEVTAEDVTKHKKNESPKVKEYMKKAYGNDYGTLFFK